MVLSHEIHILVESQRSLNPDQAVHTLRIALGGASDSQQAAPRGVP